MARRISDRQILDAVVRALVSVHGRGWRDGHVQAQDVLDRDSALDPATIADRLDALVSSGMLAKHPDGYQWAG